MTKNTYTFENLNEQNKQCLALIESLGIYELRALARIFGDNSPTTLKRNDHIKIVMDKIISGKEIRPIPLRQGRPYKELSNIEGILAELTKITGIDYNAKTGRSPQTKKTITFNQVEEDIFAQNLFPIKAKGILLKNADGQFYFQNQHNFKYVLLKDTFGVSLQEFDFVEGNAVVMNADREYLLKELKRVNFVDVADYKTKAPQTNAKDFAYNGKTYSLGGRYRFDNLTHYSNKMDEIKSLLADLKQKKIPTMAIIPNVAEEEQISVQMLGFDCPVTFKLVDKSEDVYQALVDAIEFVRRQEEIGGNLAIFIQDPVTLANIVDHCFKNNARGYMNHTDNVAELIREFSPLVQRKTTIFSTSDNADLFDPLFVSLIYKNYKAI